MNKEEYQQYLLSPHWLELRRKMRLANNHQCASCKSGKNLQLHHLTYARVGAERPGDLIVLCAKCHTFAHLLWEKVPRTFPVRWQRAMLRHFLLYCQEARNPERGSAKQRSKVNHGLNKLPMSAKAFLAESKREFNRRNPQ